MMIKASNIHHHHLLLHSIDGNPTAHRARPAWTTARC